jgi:hypothetical protein
MGIQFQDSFNRADGAIGNSWTVTLGTIDISTNQARLHTNSCTMKRQVPTPTGTDLSVALTQGPGWSYASNRTFYVRLRADSSGVTYYQWLVQLGAVGVATVVVSKVVSGVTTILAQHYQFAATSGAHVFTFECQGSTLRFLVDGVVVCQETDSTIASGDYLFTGQAGTLDTEFWDDLTIFDFAASAMYVVPSTILPGISPQVLTLYGICTSWVAGVPGTPVFTVSVGSITFQEVDGATTAMITYTPPAYPTTVIITDPGTGHVAYLNVASVLPPTAPGVLPDWLLKLIAAGLDPAVVVLGLLGYDFTNNYIARIVNELGVDVDEMPTNGHVKAILADLLLVKAELDTDDTSPDSIRHIVLGARSGVTDILADMLALTTEGAHSLADVLTAISGLAATALAEDDLDTVENNIMGSGVLSITAIGERLDALSSSGTYSLSDIVLALAGLATTAQLTTAVSTLEGIDHRTITNAYDVANNVVPALQGATAYTLTDVYGKAADAKSSADAATAAAVAASGAVAAAVIAIGGLLTAQTAAIDASLVAATVEINGEVAAAAAALAGDIAGLGGTLSSIASSLTSIDSRLTAIEAALANLKAGVPAWPGLAKATLGTPVDITYDMAIDGPLDGFRYLLTTIPSDISKYYHGSLVTSKYLGWAAFYDESGYVELFQSITWNKAVITPRSIAHPAGVVLHWRTGTVGTVTPWTIT